MAFETINLGTQPAGTGGDTARSAFEKTNRNFLAAEVLSATMSQAQFEAIRAQNKERYAASGWVSFGNHESGKQVNECKPGLYTSLTTPNTLLIGKAGGVGGSKTDHASVHIDGVVFSLTNQFVLTMPSHPTSTQPERMDMYGLESEKVEISAASPNAYQGGLRGVGAAVNLFTATDQQKKDFFAQNSNTTYIGTDGKIYQWQLYKISFAGTTDGVPSPSEQGYSRNTLGDLWLKAGKSLLYFGNVLRLNDGGYHPSFNPLGAAKFVGDTFWYNTAASITSQADCFDPAKLLAGSGSIASGKSGRPEIGGRYYDAIYASGFGGVSRDMRYSANGVDSFVYAGADQRAKSGTYRGFEFVRITKVISFVTSSSETASNYGRVPMTRAEALRVCGLIGVSTGGATIFHQAKMAVSLYNPANGKFIHSALIVADQGNSNFGTYLDPANQSAIWLGFDQKVVENNLSGNQVLMLAGNTASADSNIFCSSGQTLYAIVTTLDKLSVGGSFLQTDVIANPVNIPAIPSLANGWSGSWGGLPEIGSGITMKPLTRKCLSSSTQITYTTNNGVSWGFSATESVDNATNTVGHANVAASIVYLDNYTAFAKQTENAVNTAVYGGDAGVGKVCAQSLHLPEWGCVFGESLCGIVCKNTAAPEGVTQPLTRYLLNPHGEFNVANVNSPKHAALDIVLIPSNNSPAFKTINYNVNINQQANIQYAYTELRNNGTNWGDDGKVTIVDNQSTKTDLNSNTVLVGTAKLKEPIGWIKNKV